MGDPILDAEEVARILALIGWGGDADGPDRVIASHEALRARVATLTEAVGRAANEGRNVLPDATDRQASMIEQWAIEVLGEVLTPMDEIERSMYGTPKSPEVIALERRVAALTEALHTVRALVVPMDNAPDTVDPIIAKVIVEQIDAVLGGTDTMSDPRIFHWMLSNRTGADHFEMYRVACAERDVWHKIAHEEGKRVEAERARVAELTAERDAAEESASFHARCGAENAIKAQAAEARVAVLTEAIEAFLAAWNEAKTFGAGSAAVTRFARAVLVGGTDTP